MSNALFPSFAGLGWNREKTPVWRTSVKQAASGKEKRAALWSYPQWAIKLSYEFLEDDQSVNSDLRSVVGFFNLRMGAFDDFLYNDPYDNTVTDQAIGVGDGVTKMFQLARNVGGWIEPIKDVQGLADIYVDGVKKTSGYTLINGLVTFTVPPTAGQLITATFMFFYRVRFNMDDMNTNLFLHNLYELKKIEMVSVK